MLKGKFHVKFFYALLEPVLLTQAPIQIISVSPKQLNGDVQYMQAAFLDHKERYKHSVKLVLFSFVHV